MSEMDDLLKACDATMADIPADGTGLEVPPGKYIASVGQCEICQSKQSKRVHIKMPFEIQDTKFKGLTKWSYDLRFTDTEGNPDMKGMSFFKLACIRLGLPAPSTVEEAGGVVAQFSGRVCEIEITKSGEFINTRIIRLIHENYFKWIDEGEKSSAGPEIDDKAW